MRRVLSLLIALACGVGVTAPAAAQHVLTESEAVGRASLESPRGRAIRAAVDLVRAEASAASIWPNPRVTYSREAVGGVAEQYLLFSQSLPVTGRRGLASEGARQSVRAAEFRADDTLRRLRADARRAFIALSVEESRVRQLEKSRDDLQALAEILAKRERAGDAAGFDRLRAERDALEIAAVLGAARADRARRRGELASYFHPPPAPESLRAAPLSPVRLPLPTAEDLVARAEAARPDLLALGRDIEAARLAGEAAARSLIPEPELVAGLKTTSAGDNRRGSVFSLSASLPLFDRAQPWRTRADASMRQATAERDALRTEVETAVRALRSVAEERRATADAYRRVVLPASDELRRIAQVSYEAGERGILELLDAYRLASDGWLRLIELDAAAAHADIDLELATAVEIRQ